MKKLICLLILILLVVSCDQFQKKTIQDKEKIEEPNPIVETKEEIKEEPYEIDNNLISFEKSPCSGDCPVFNIEISKDSIFTFHGISYTHLKGKHQIKLTDLEFQKLMKALEDSNFEDLADVYSSGDDKDYSENTFSYQGKKVKVLLWKDAPKELLSVYTLLENILYENKFLVE